jgi:hypothetical protein
VLLLLLLQLTYTAHMLPLVMAMVQLIRILLGWLQLLQSMLWHQQLQEVMLVLQRLTQLLMLTQAYRSWVRCLLVCGLGPCACLFPATQAALLAAAAVGVLSSPATAGAGAAAAMPHLHGCLLQQLQHHLLGLLRQRQVYLCCLLLWLCMACRAVAAALW